MKKYLLYALAAVTFMASCTEQIDTSSRYVFKEENDTFSNSPPLRLIVIVKPCISSAFALHANAKSVIKRVKIFVFICF